MLLIVESHVGGVQGEEVPDLVRHVGPHALVAAILEPYLKESLLGPQRQTRSDHVRLLKLFAYRVKREKSAYFESVKVPRARELDLPIIANKIDSHILSMLSSFLILMIQMPPAGDSYKVSLH